MKRMVWNAACTVGEYWHWKYISNSNAHSLTQLSQISHAHPPQRLYQSFSFAKLVFHSRFPALHSRQISPLCFCLLACIHFYCSLRDVHLLRRRGMARTINSIFLIARGLFLPPIFIVHFIWRWVALFSRSLSRMVPTTALMLAINRL